MKLTFGVLLIIYLSSCTQPSVDATPTGPTDYCAATVAEVAVCNTSITYTSPITVTGTASFYKRGLDLNHTTNSGLTLGAKISTALPIKYAEVRILNGTNVVQCGTTDNTGALKAVDGVSPLMIPGAVASYTVEVLSRVNHVLGGTGGKPAFTVNTSVKKEICNNELHNVSGTLASASPSITLTAQAEESLSAEINGGAFNILNDIFTAYDYIGNNTSMQDVSCLSPKLEVYWKAGFNPGQYIDRTSDPANVDNISFYLRGYNQLYINGGKLGNVTTVDTDQFDDAVIIHELGHHVEDVCGKMDSPGGTHYGLFRIDPRLAWSEGWGNFFGAHIIKNNLALINPDLVATLTPTGGWLYYLDTSGYNDGAVQSGNKLISLNLTKPGNNPEQFSSGYYYDKVDPAAFPGEGHFREVSVSRSLFKSTNTCSTCTGNNHFSQMWQAFSSMGSANYPFRSSVRFYNRLNAIATMTDVDAILNNDEAQQRDGNVAYTSGVNKTWVPYGVKLVSSATPCNLRIQPRQESVTVTHQQSDQRYSSHFYYLDRTTLPSVTQINLTANKQAGSNVDIDLILFAEGFHYPVEICLNYDSSGDCASYSKNTTSSEYIRSDRSAGLNKSISNINGLPTSTPYLLNVKAFTAGITVTNNTEYSYTLTTDTGAFLCPTTF